MQALRKHWRIWVLAVGTLLWFTSGAPRAESPFAGNWTVKHLVNGSEVSLWLIQVAEKEGKLDGQVLDAMSQLPAGSTIKDVSAQKNEVNITLDVAGNPIGVTAYAPEDNKTPESLKGSISLRGERQMVRLDRTKDKTLDASKTVSQGAAGKAYMKTFYIGDEVELAKQLRAILKEHPEDPIVIKAVNRLLPLLGAKAKDGELQELAKRAVDQAAEYGPPMKQATLLEVSKALLRADGGAKLALEYARQAREGLGDKADAAEQQNVLRTIASALRQTDQPEEASKVEAEVARLDQALDEAFAKTNIPFEPKKQAAGKGSRTVLVELFTGAECPPCVALDAAFDALLKSYEPKNVVQLQYHLHVPRPDPLTNEEVVSRSLYYKVEGTPMVYVDGQLQEVGGGPRPYAEQRYNELLAIVKKDMEKPAGGQVDLSASRKGNLVEMTAKVSDLSKSGKTIRLRFVLVEDVVRYPGGNGQRLHHHVVRAFPGGEPGVAMTDKSGTYSESIDVTDLTKTLNAYLGNYHKTEGAFPRTVWPMELENLKVVAFLQDNETKEILNAAQVDVK